MDLEYFNKAYHVDIATQIDNKWKTDTALGIVKDFRKFSIKLKGNNKEEIKKRFIINENSDSAKKHDKRVVALVYSYLLYKALCDFPEAKPLLICRDVRPERLVMHYLQKLANFFKNRDTFGREIRFRKREDRKDGKMPKSLAGKYVRKVYQEKIKATKIINKEELEELISLIGKLL